jgi:hypothetical protein
VQIWFTSSRSAPEVLAYAGAVMARNGWLSGRVAERDGPGVGSDWTQPTSSAFPVALSIVTPSSAFRVALSNNTPNGYWAITGSAAPVGQRVSGC